MLYSSVDDALLRDIVAVFERECNVNVKLVGDTEATKTTGLVERLASEKDRPRADVWWSSEPFGTIRLAHEGVLEAYTSGEEKGMEGGWPKEFRGRGGTWYGFASRVRVIVYSTDKGRPEPPHTLGDLTAARFAGRIGMARPQFGTTRGQMGGLLAEFGEPALRAWLAGLKSNRVRLYDGNSAVVKAVAYGEIDAGLTDTDDVYAGQREGWKVAMAMAPARLGGGTATADDRAMLIPNTVARVKGGPHPKEAATLIDFLLSERCERMMAKSESRNIPVRAWLATDLGQEQAASRLPDLERAAEGIPAAMRACDEILK